MITSHDSPEETKEQGSPANTEAGPVAEPKKQSKAKQLRSFAMSGFGMASSRPKTAVPQAKDKLSEKQIDDIMGQGLGMSQNKLKLEEYDYGQVDEKFRRMALLSDYEQFRKPN